MSSHTSPSRRAPLTLTRRDALTLALAAGIVPFRPSASRAEALAPFSFDGLTEEMRAAAEDAYETPSAPEVTPWAGDYDAYRKISFRPDHARWQDRGPFHLHAFHLGWLFEQPVRLFEVEGGEAREIVFSTEDFRYHGEMGEELGEDHTLPGVAGFRLNTTLNRPDRYDELVSFLGASYFRALGRGSVYGLSARGVAIDTATDKAEEFPSFTRFWFDRAEVPGAVTVYAALDGPSLTGAYRFVIRPGATTEMEVTARLFPRGEIGQLGLAPMTSMFLYSERNRSDFDDYRPQVHDSEGLRIRRRDGDILWRPLNNPPRLASSYFEEERPLSFGLHQRDRQFEDYQDSGARYERRPSLEVVPQGDWGRGTIRLVEIPTDLEANDNIVAFWVPEAPVKAGEMQEVSYLLRWGDMPAESEETDLAHVAETYAGAGGVAGVESPENTRKFVIDFAGGMLADLPPESSRPTLPEQDRVAADATPKIELVANASGGRIVSATLHKLESTGHWRAALDVEAQEEGPIELSAHVAGYGRKLSEVWLCQWMQA